MAAQPASPVPTISPAEMQILISRSGLVLNPGQMADLVLAWRQVAGLIAAIPQGRPLADDAALGFRLPAPATAAASRSPGAVPAGSAEAKSARASAAEPTAAGKAARRSAAKAAPRTAAKATPRAAAKAAPGAKAKARSAAKATPRAGAKAGPSSRAKSAPKTKAAPPRQAARQRASRGQ